MRANPTPNGKDITPVPHPPPHPPLSQTTRTWNVPIPHHVDHRLGSSTFIAIRAPVCQPDPTQTFGLCSNKHLVTSTNGINCAPIQCSPDLCAVYPLHLFHDHSFPSSTSTTTAATASDHKPQTSINFYTHQTRHPTHPTTTTIVTTPRVCVPRRQTTVGTALGTKW